MCSPALNCAPDLFERKRQPVHFILLLLPQTMYDMSVRSVINFFDVEPFNTAMTNVETINVWGVW